MTPQTVDVITQLVNGDNTIPAAQRAAILRVVRREKSREDLGKWIPAKEACKLLGTAFGKPASRPYLKSLVDAGRLHPKKFSERKTVYNEDELLDLLDFSKNEDE